MSEDIKTEIPNYRFDKDEFDLKEYAKVIIKRRRAIYNIILLCVLISAIFGLLLPKTYGYKIAVAVISGLMLGLLIIFMQEFLGRGQRN